MLPRSPSPYPQLAEFDYTLMQMCCFFTACLENSPQHFLFTNNKFLILISDTCVEGWIILHDLDRGHDAIKYGAGLLQHLIALASRQPYPIQFGLHSGVRHRPCTSMHQQYRLHNRPSHHFLNQKQQSCKST